MTAFSDLAQPSPLFRQHEYVYQGKAYNDLWFWCPGCESHHCIDAARWTFNGDYHAPTFDPSYRTWNDPDPRAAEGSKYRTGWNCHSYIRNGQIEFLPDCTHKLAGQTVPIPQWDDNRKCVD